MAKNRRTVEEERASSPTPAQAELADAVPVVELPEMSGYGIHFDRDSGKWLAVRVTNYGTVELLSPRGPESKHSATARAFEAFKRSIASARRT